MLTSLTYFLHSVLRMEYRWRPCRLLCYWTFYKCFIESEILASLYLSAGGWSTQPSLCAYWHRNFTMQSTCCILAQICLYYEFVSTVWHGKNILLIIFPLYCWYPVSLGLVRLSKHVFRIGLYHPLLVNHLAHRSRWLAASYEASHRVRVFGTGVGVMTSSIPTCPEGFEKAGDRHGDIKTRRSERVTPFRAPPLHRSLFMLLFIIVPSNPCLVHYTRAAICQHLAGGLQGSKQQIGCTEPNM